MYINNYNYSCKLNNNAQITFGTTTPTKETAVQGLLKDIDSQVYLFENPKFYEFFDANKSAMTEKIKEMYNRNPWGSDKGRDIISEFIQNVSDKHIALLCDPGIVSRTEELYSFVKNLPVDINKLSSLELRKMFSDSLGTQKYYRGMTLTEEQVETIKKEGIKSINFVGENREQIFESLFLGKSDYEYTSFKRFMDKKVSGINRNNPMISVTQIEKIAQKVTSRYSRPKNIDQKIYIFELEIPKINTVEPIKDFEIYYPGFGFYDKSGKKIPTEQVESFVPFVINSSCIKSIKTFTPEPARPYLF